MEQTYFYVTMSVTEADVICEISKKDMMCIC